MAKYLSDSSGIMTEVATITSSAGAGDSGKIPSLDSTGLLDISFMPVGVGQEVTIVVTSENLTAGNFVNLYSNSGTATGRKADATLSSKFAVGFTLANVTSPANVTIYGISNKNTQLSSLTIGSAYYLSTTAGGVTVTSPSGSGNIVQRLGIAESTTAIVYSDSGYWVKA